jgi:hypothetical protein
LSSRKERLALFDWLRTEAVTPVTHAPEATCNRPEPEKTQQDQGLLDSVTPVTRVTRKNDEARQVSEKFARPGSGAKENSGNLPPTIENPCNPCNPCNPPTKPNDSGTFPPDARLHTPESARVTGVTAEVAAEISRIEADTRRQGWPPELLWNAGFWDQPRGLAAVMDPGDQIVEVTADAIAILKFKHDLQRFYRRNG